MKQILLIISKTIFRKPPLEGDVWRWCFFFAALLMAATLQAADVKYPVAAIPDSLKAGSNAVVRLDDVTVNVIDDAHADVSSIYAVTVLNENGRSVACFNEITDDYDRLTDFRAVIYDAEGKVVKRVKRNELIRSEYSGENTLADDNVKYVYIPSHSEYPFTVEYTFSIESKKLVSTYPTFFPLSQTEASTQEAHYRLITPKGFEVMTQEFNPQWKKTINETPKGKEQCWHIQGLKAIKYERFMPDADTFLPIVYVEPKQFDFEGTKVSNESWQAYGQWIFSLMEGRGTLPDELKAKVHELTDGLSSRRGKIEALYKYMCETCRYTNVTLGIGGLQPKTVADTYRTKYGDCKALVFYLLSMLREIGIESNMCLISTNYERICPDFALHRGINHVILKVAATADEESLWIECTNSKLPFAYIHSDMDGHDVVVIANGNSHIETIPEQSADYHYERNIATLSIAADGEITGNHIIEKEGEEAETKDYKTRKSNTQNSISVDVNPFNEGYSKLRMPRTYDIALAMSCSEYDSVVYSLPKDFEVDIIPAAANESSPFGTFNANYTYNADEHALVSVQRLQWHKGISSKSEATALKRFLDVINKHRKATIIIRRKKTA